MFLVFVYMHFAGRQPALEGSQQQAAAAGKATPRVRRQASFRQWDRTKLKVKKVQKHKSSKSLSRTWLERRWWCGGSPGWTRCLWSSVKLSRCSLVFLALCSTWLVPSGRRLQEDVTLVQSGIGPDSSLFMSTRLRGGAMRQRAPLVPGSWTCSNCNMGGCWPSKNVCFRCLAPRPTHGPQ